MIKILKYTLSVILIFLLSTFLYREKSSEAFDSIITFLSIVVGFCFTALSIISTSKFARDLYEKEDKKDNSKTLLHNLIYQFKVCVLNCTIAIIIVLIYNYFEGFEFNQYHICKVDISLGAVIIGSIWFFTFSSIIRFMQLIQLFSKFVVQNAKRSRKID